MVLFLCKVVSSFLKICYDFLFLDNKMKFRSLLFLFGLLASLVVFSANESKPHFTTLEGQYLYGKDLKGRWLILHYWASWCDVCMSEMPEMQKFYRTLSSKKAQMFLVNYDHLTIVQQQKLMSKMGVNIPGLKGHPAQLFGINEISALPMTIIVNPNGKVKKVLEGPQTSKSLTSLMK